MDITLPLKFEDMQRDLLQVRNFNIKEAHDNTMALDFE